MATTGHELLVPLIAGVQQLSHDRATRDGEPAAHLAFLRGMRHDPTHWEVAIARATSEPIGFVLPAWTGDEAATIAFIGVLPEARGRGLGRLLLARGTASLRRRSPRVIADIDEDNLPMLRAAAAVGYRPFAIRAHYRRRTLSGDG